MGKRVQIYYEKIPGELKGISQWVNWKYLESRGKETKPPCSTKGNNIDAHNKKNWLNFEEAKAAFEKNSKLAGIGLVLTPELNLVGIDLDQCIDEAGQPESWALEIVHDMKSYTEISPSGNGLRIFLWGHLPERVNGKKKAKVEIYTSGRYLTVTGNVLSEQGGQPCTQK